MTNILDLTPKELEAKFAAAGFERYRARQVLHWIYARGVYAFERMTDLPVEFRRKIKDVFVIGVPEEAGRERSGEDQSIKLLLKLHDGDTVETVAIPRGERRTVCVSTQVGCKFHCAFCASGQNGFLRNLSAGEMLAQVLRARDTVPGKPLTNVVFMGIGEPFDNYRELLKTIRTLNAKETLGLGARRITISTCGLVPKIEALAEEGLQVELSVSLHGPSDAVRGLIMPVNRAYPVEPLIAACRKYAKKTGRAVTFEYILIRGVNASAQDATKLVRLLKNLLCKVNLIPYNPIQEFPHVAPPYPEIVQFQKILQKGGVRTTVRFSRGRDIQAACGQLRAAQPQP